LKIEELTLVKIDWVMGNSFNYPEVFGIKKNGFCFRMSNANCSRKKNEEEK